MNYIKKYRIINYDFMLVIMRIVENAGTSFAFPTRTIEFAKNTLPEELTMKG